MKHLISRFSWLIITLMLTCVTALAQDMKVKSFGLAQGDLYAASTKYARLDVSGKRCALIKISLPLQGVRFDGDIVGDVKYDFGEYWVFMAVSSRQLKIVHDNYPPLLVTFANFGIESVETANTYNLIIQLPQKIPNNQSVKAGDVLSFNVNGIVFEMVRVEGGTFNMGATVEQGEALRLYASPVHQVTLNDYYIAKTEVTQALWEAVTGESVTEMYEEEGSNVVIAGANYPMQGISWDEYQDFINKLNTLTGKNFRLPTEAEWEYAARGGKKSKGYRYSGSNDLDDVAWHWRNSGDEYLPEKNNRQRSQPVIDMINNWKTHPVATKSPNELGLYDMSGNVEEWCSDRSGEYSSEPQKNPQGAVTGSYRVCRGGGWCSNDEECRNAYRSSSLPYFPLPIGARLALSCDKKSR